MVCKYLKFFVEFKSILNTYVPLFSRKSTELFGWQSQKHALDNTKARKKPWRCLKWLVKLKRILFCQSFQWETNNHHGEVLENISNIPPVNIFECHNNKGGRKIQQTNASKWNGKGKIWKTSGNSLLLHFSRSSSTREIKTRSTLGKGNIPEKIRENVHLGRRIAYFF